MNTVLLYVMGAILYLVCWVCFFALLIVPGLGWQGLWPF